MRRDDGETYTLNLMDTPGHVDFAYEVSRSLAACEGSLLVVDALSGGSKRRRWPTSIRPSTMITRSCRFSTRSTCLPPSRSGCAPQIEDVIGIDASEAIEASAKSGIGIKETLEAIVKRLPRARRRQGSTAEGLAWLIVIMTSIWASWLSVRIIDGELKKGDKIRMMGTGSIL